MMRHWLVPALIVMAAIPAHPALASAVMGGNKEVLGPAWDRFQIVVKTDSLVVYRVSANDGQCKIDEFKIDTPNKTETSPPLDADYGDPITVSAHCDVRELKFETSRGPIILDWK